MLKMDLQTNVKKRIETHLLLYDYLMFKMI